MEAWGFLILIRRFKELTLFEMSSQDRWVQVIPFRRNDTISRRPAAHFHIRLQGVLATILTQMSRMLLGPSCHELLPFENETILGLEFKALFGFVTISHTNSILHYARWQSVTCTCELTFLLWWRPKHASFVKPENPTESLRVDV